MNRKTFTVEVTQLVEVTLDADKFDEAFLAEFRESFYPYYTLSDHAKHIAQLEARGLTELWLRPEFVEGYGNSDEMGIAAKVIETDIDEVQA